MRSQKGIAGFSLLELLIVMVIVATLAAIAYPSYQQHITRSKRAAVQQYLLEVSSLQHQFILDNRSYVTTLAALGTAPVSPKSSLKLICRGISRPGAL